MIIDTAKIDYKELRTIAHIIYESDMIPNEEGLFTAAKENSHCTLYYDDIIKDGKSIFDFGYGGESFRIYNMTHGKANRLVLKSLKRLPTHCKEFSLNKFIIEDIDYLPKAEEYNFHNCIINKLSYPFPDNIVELWLKRANVSSFDLFPKIIEKGLMLDNVTVVNSENFPIVNGSINIEKCKKLKELDNIKGDYVELELSDLNNLESIGKISTKLETIQISSCAKLKVIKGLKDIPEDCTFYLNSCDSLDPYETLQSNAMVNYTGSFSDNFMLYYAAFYGKLSNGKLERFLDPRGLSKEEFEWEVLKYWTSDPRTKSNAEKIELKFDSNIKKREQIFASNKGIEKFKL